MQVFALMGKWDDFKNQTKYFPTDPMINDHNFLDQDRGLTTMSIDYILNNDTSMALSTKIIPIHFHNQVKNVKNNRKLL